MFCPQCGREVRQQDGYCPTCGFLLPGEVILEPEYVQTCESTPRLPGLMIWTRIELLMFTLILICHMQFFVDSLDVSRTILRPAIAICQFIILALNAVFILGLRSFIIRAPGFISDLLGFERLLFILFLGMTIYRNWVIHERSWWIWIPVFFALVGVPSIIQKKARELHPEKVVISDQT